jgi:flagellar basal-body rod modification protein FlgD
MPIPPVTSATIGTTTPDSVTNTSQALNQQDFLQLLVSQMENQDPMNPQSNTDMAAQMAQFTSLTQSSAMSASLAMMQANSLIGSTVTLQVTPQSTATGTVQGVVLQNGTPQILVNGSTYTLSQVTSVTPPAANTSATGTTGNTSSTN